MEINNVTIERGLLGKPYYGAPPVKEGVGTSKNNKDDSGQHDEITRSTTDDDKIALSRDKTTTPDSRSLVPVKQFLTKDDTANSFPDKGIGPKKAFNVVKVGYSLNIDTQFLKDQYTIGKVATDITERIVNKYKEAQLYRHRPTSTLEVYA